MIEVFFLELSITWYWDFKQNIVFKYLITDRTELTFDGTEKRKRSSNFHSQEIESLLSLIDEEKSIIGKKLHSMIAPISNSLNHKSDENILKWFSNISYTSDFFLGHYFHFSKTFNYWIIGGKTEILPIVSFWVGTHRNQNLNWTSLSAVRTTENVIHEL